MHVLGSYNIILKTFFFYNSYILHYSTFTPYTYGACMCSMYLQTGAVCSKSLERTFQIAFLYRAIILARKNIYLNLLLCTPLFL